MMTTVFEGSLPFVAFRGDYARVMVFDDRVGIRAIDAMDEEAATISMTPAQARELAQGIIAAANDAEAGE